ncbi:MAG: phage tail protein [Catonella sp.]|jgi:core tail protein|nr:MAG: phage tail protein [Catonella sp.]
MVLAMNQQDTISSKEGTVFATVDGKNIAFAEIIEMEAKVELKTVDVTPLGQRMTSKKVVGAEGTGSIKYYYQNPAIRNIIAKYVQEGKIPEISIKYANEDPTSHAGRNSGVLKGVIFEKALLFKASGDNNVLEEETDFSFNDIEILESFKQA